MENENEFGFEIELEADDGTKQSFDLLDVIDYEDNTYAVLLPVADEEDVCYIVLRIEELDDEFDNYLNVEDDDIVQAVFGIFMEKYPELFEDEEEE